MRSSVSTLVLLAAPALVLAEPLPGSAPAPAEAVLAPALASSVEVAPPAPAPPEPGASAPAGAAATPPRDQARPRVIPTEALIEKLGKGDRLFLAGDHRNALFAYQDAVYLQPGYAPARVKLGRAYLALRYPAQAIAQAEAALAGDPESTDARALLEEASAASARAESPTLAPTPTGGRVFRLHPEGSTPTRDAAAAGPPPGPPPAR